MQCNQRNYYHAYFTLVASCWQHKSYILLSSCTYYYYHETLLLNNCLNDCWLNLTKLCLRIHYSSKLVANIQFLHALLLLKQHVLRLRLKRLLSSLFFSYLDLFKFQKLMLCHADRSKSLLFANYNSLHLHNSSRVHLLDHVRRMCDLCVMNLLRFLSNSLLVILVRSKYMLLSQILSTNFNNNVSSCLNLN